VAERRRDVRLCDGETKGAQRQLRRWWGCSEEGEGVYQGLLVLSVCAWLVQGEGGERARGGGGSEN